MPGKPLKERKKVLDPEVWVADHGDYLFRYALARLQDRGSAEDVVQETFLAAMKARDQFKGHAYERTWLVGILKHKIADWFRKRSREFLVGDLLSEYQAPNSPFDELGGWKAPPTLWPDDPSGALDQKEFREALLACLAELPRRAAQIFTLREVEGLSAEEICNLVGLSPTNLWVIMYRARKRLRRCLETNWFEGTREGR
jgi:RNA polymerase sigma-70 factor (ECF subfamily)